MKAKNNNNNNSGNEPPHPYWQPGLYEKEKGHSAQPSPMENRGSGPQLIEKASAQFTSSTHPTLTQLVAGCGIAAIDGYLIMKDYAKSKGLDLEELQFKGIDLQDLISTLIIYYQKAQPKAKAAAAPSPRKKAA